MSDDPSGQQVADEKPRRPNRRGQGWVHRRGRRVWWISYGFRGEVYRESSGSPNRTDAVKLLRRRLAEIGKGQLIGPDVERTRFADLERGLVDDYRINARRSAGRLETSLKHLRSFFALYRAVEITTDRITSYVVARQAEGAANATINRELAALKRMLTL